MMSGALLRAFGAALLATVVSVATVAQEQKGYLGVRIRPVPEALASHLEIESGVMIAEVVQGSPADRAGLQRNDVVLALDGTPVKSPDVLADAIRGRDAGDSVVLEIRRGSETLELSASLDPRASEKVPEKEPEIDADRRRLESPQAPPTPTPARRPGFLGVQFDEVPPSLASHLDLPDGVGILLNGIFPDSPADRAGLRKNDVILALDGEKIGAGAAFVEKVATKVPGDEVRLTVIQRGREREIDVVLGEAPEVEASEAPRIRIPGQVPGFPDSRLKGRFRFRDRDGKERDLDLPDYFGEPEKLQEWFDQLLEDRNRVMPPDIRGRLGELLKRFPDSGRGIFPDLDRLSPDGFFRRGPGSMSGENHSRSESRLIQGGYDITVKDVNGFRSVTVRKDGKVLADDLPVGEIDSLPAEVREKVERMIEELPLLKVPHGPKLRVPEKKVRSQTRRL